MLSLFQSPFAAFWLVWWLELSLVGFELIESMLGRLRSGCKFFYIWYFYMIWTRFLLYLHHVRVRLTVQFGKVYRGLSPRLLGLRVAGLFLIQFEGYVRVDHYIKRDWTKTELVLQEYPVVVQIPAGLSHFDLRLLKKLDQREQVVRLLPV